MAYFSLISPIQTLSTQFYCGLLKYREIAPVSICYGFGAEWWSRRPKLAFGDNTTQARQSALVINRGAICCTSFSQTRIPNREFIFSSQYFSSPRMCRLYLSFKVVICPAVRLSNCFTASTAAVAATGPELTFRNSLSPFSIRDSHLCLVR